MKEHGLEGFITKLKRDQCQAIITIGFGKYFTGLAMKVEEQRKKVRGFISDPDFEAISWFLERRKSDHTASTIQGTNQLQIQIQR